MFSFFRVASSSSSSSFSSAFGVGFSSSSAEPNLSFILYESRPLNKSLFPSLHLRGQHCPRSGGWRAWDETLTKSIGEILHHHFPFLFLPSRIIAQINERIQVQFNQARFSWDWYRFQDNERDASSILLLLLLRIRHRHPSTIHQQHRQIVVLFLFLSFHLCPDLIVDSARGTLQRTIQHDTLTLHPGDTHSPTQNPMPVQFSLFVLFSSLLLLFSFVMRITPTQSFTRKLLVSLSPFDRVSLHYSSSFI